MTANPTGQHRAGIIGRTLRLMLGMLLVWMALTVTRAETDLPYTRVVAVVIGLLVLYQALHTIVPKYLSRVGPWKTSVAALVPIVLVFAFGGTLGRLGSVCYAAIALFLQTVRADGGCIVMAIPAFLSRRPTELPGILFAPIDLVEKHLTGPGGLPG